MKKKKQQKNNDNAAEKRVVFTKEMKKNYKILMPTMLPIHFELIRRSLVLHGYDAELLTETGREVIDEGLKNVHNDTCYPALLVIGQMIHALKSGKYDLNKTALIITQTGGGCRASNYIHLLRKALKKSNFDNIPVISVNLSGLESNPGFNLSIPLVKKMVYSIVYGDMLMLLSNQTRPYEKVAGESDKMVQKWLDILEQDYKISQNVTAKRVYANFELIAKDFAGIELDKSVIKVKVGIVGEIFVKYAPLGNNNLEHFLRTENVEFFVPGLLDFIIFKTDNRLVDIDIYGGNFMKYFIVKKFKKFLIEIEDKLIETVSKYEQFTAPSQFEKMKQSVTSYIGHGNKMGEGWLLTGEMLELINSGYKNIVCTQPFGCLPNHIVGKGMIRKIKTNHPDSNIVAIDYDASATRINQENRIKLMLANAQLNLRAKVLAEKNEYSEEDTRLTSIEQNNIIENNDKSAEEKSVVLTS